MANLNEIIETMPWLGHWKHRFEIIGSTKRTIKFWCEGCGELRAYRRSGLKRVLTTKSIRGRKLRRRDLAQKVVWYNGH